MVIAVSTVAASPPTLPDHVVQAYDVPAVVTVDTVAMPVFAYVGSPAEYGVFIAAIDFTYLQPEKNDYRWRLYASSSTAARNYELLRPPLVKYLDKKSHLFNNKILNSIEIRVASRLRC